MNINDLNIEKGGYITIGSIFELGCLDITLLVDKCRRAGCTLRFENEDITIDESYSNDTVKMATVTLYTLLAGHPKAAMDYIRYCVQTATKKGPNAV